MEPERDEYRRAHPYMSEDEPPGPDSPRRGLPVPHRQVWAALQDGLRNLPRVRETVTWCGEGWRWSWQYSVGDRDLAFLIPSERGVSAMLIVEDPILSDLLGHDDMRPSMRSRLSETEEGREVHRCWTPVLDVDSARDFLLSARALIELMRSPSE